MDYRTRNYYLVNIDTCSYEMRLRYYKMAANTLKIHPPFKHFKNSIVPRDCCNDTCWQMLLSCKKEESEALEYELRKAERRDGLGSTFIKVDKELFGQ